MKTAYAITVIFVTLLPATTVAQDTTPHPSAQALEDQAWDGFYHCKINWRYHIAEAARWGWLDNVTRAATISLAFLSCIGTLLSTNRRWLRCLWIIAALASFVVSMVPFVLPFGSWTSEHIILAARWNQLANDWYDAYRPPAGVDIKQIAEQVFKLRKATTDLENDEPTPRYNPKVMAAAEKAEDEYQGINSPPKTAPDAVPPG